MRTKKSIYNVFTVFCQYCMATITGLFLRRVFLECLGLGFVGLDSVFANILSLLCLVELGIGPAITYRLYKPLAEKNIHEIVLLMGVYKRLYSYIAIAVATVGLLIAPFIPVIANDPPIHGIELIICYLLYLSSTVISYFFAHRRSLLVADQRQYTTTWIDIIFNLIFFIVKVITLIVTRNYILVLIINILRVVLNNLFIAIVCKKTYPYIKEIKTLPAKEITEKCKDMIRDVTFILLHKFCNYVYSSTDGIVISTFMGVTSVGLLSNYNMIVSVVSGVFMQGSSSIQASVGNLVNSVDNKEKVVVNLKRLSYLYFVILSFCSTSLFCLLTPFISLWLGPQYALAQSIIAVICINLYIYSYYQPIANIYTVTGLFKTDFITSPVAAIINLTISIIAVKNYGLIGVYIGTILGSLVYIIGRTIVVYNSYFKCSMKGYVIVALRYFIVSLLECAFTYFITKHILGDNIVAFVLKMVTCVVVPFFLNFVLFFRTEEQRYFCELIKRVMKRKL